MKLPRVDLAAVTHANFVKNVGFKNKFLKYWGDDGTVLTEKLYYYPSGHLHANEKIFKLLKMYDTLEESSRSMSGVESAWVYLNPAKVEDIDLEGQILASKMNDTLPLDEYVSYEVGINYQRPYTVTSSRFSGLFDNRSYEKQDEPVVDEVLGAGTKEEMNEYIQNNWGFIHKSYNVLPDQTDDATRAISLHALYGDVEKVTTTVSSASREILEKTRKVVTEDSDGHEKVRYVPYSEVAITFRLTVKRVGIIGEESPIVTHMLDYIDEQARIAAAELAKAEQSTDSGTGITSMVKPPVTNSLFLDGQLRTSLFSIKTGPKSAELNELLSRMIDSGYQQKKVSSGKKFIGIIIVVIIIYYTGGTGAGSAAALAGSTTVTLSTVALQFTIAALALSLTSMAMAAWGDSTGAAAVAHVAKGVGLIASFLGITAMIQNMVSSLAANTVTRETATKVLQAAGAEVTESAITTEMTKQFISRSIDRVYEMVATKLQSMTELTFGNVVKQINRVANMVMKNRMEDIQVEANEIREGMEEAERLEAERLKEESQSKDLAAAFIASYTNQILQDQGRYNFDYPYEPTDTNIGKQFFPVIMSSPVKDRVS